jgi:hypothetical protein
LSVRKPIIAKTPFSKDTRGIVVVLVRRNPGDHDLTSPGTNAAADLDPQVSMQAVDIKLTPSQKPTYLLHHRITISPKVHTALMLLGDFKGS